MKTVATGRGKKKTPAPVARILVIDDEVDMLNNYSRLLKRAGHDCLTTTEPSQVESLLASFKPDLVITDIVMPKLSGLEVLEKVHEFDRSIPVILVTAFGSINNAVEAMKRNAWDYLTKPCSVNELLGKVQEALSNRLLERTTSAAPETQEEGEEWRTSIIGISPAMEDVLNLARKVARTDVNVLIIGESGTGKEVIARAIHRISARRNEPFVPVDCASLPENLLESELFGYCKGAFTGATSDKMGLFEFANQGTLFLDEIGEMPISLQVKLLRVLQERRVRPIGGVNETEIEVRVIAASNHDLSHALKEKTFRSDLYYRLNVFTLGLPPLRDRREDVPLLADHFLRQFVEDNNLPLESIASEALECLKRYDWPGNVRELQNAVEHAATLATEATIQLGDLPDEIRQCQEETPGRALTKLPLFATKNKMVGNLEREYLMSLLVEHRFNLSRAAEAAGCHRRTLYRMIHRHRIGLEFIKEQRRALRKNRPPRPPSVS